MTAVVHGFRLNILKSDTLAQDNRYDLAIDGYSKAILLQPSNAWLYLKRGRLLDKIGKVSLAKADYLDFIKMQPSHIQGHWILGNLEARLGNFDQAIKYLSDAIDIDSQNAVLYRDRARVYTKLSDRESALVDLKMAKQIESNACVSTTN